MHAMVLLVIAMFAILVLLPSWLLGVGSLGILGVLRGRRAR